MPTRLLRLMAATLFVVAADTAPAQEAMPAAPPPAPPATAADSGVHLRVAGDLTVGPEAREALVVVIGGSVRVQGAVRAVVVLRGNAVIDGGRVQDLTVVRGRAELMNAGVVTGDVHLLDAELMLGEGSRVDGTVERGMVGRLARDVVRIGALLGLGVLLALIVGGVIVAVVAPQSLAATAALLRTDTGATAAGGALLFLAAPIAAALLIPTVIGLPIGLGYFLFVMPTLAFIGLIVAGSWVGDWVLHRVGGAAVRPRPVLGVAIGMAALILFGRIPVVGMLTGIMVALGAGALGVMTLRAVRAHRAAAGGGH